MTVKFDVLYLVLAEVPRNRSNPSKLLTYFVVVSCDIREKIAYLSLVRQKFRPHFPDLFHHK